MCVYLCEYTQQEQWDDLMPRYMSVFRGADIILSRVTNGSNVARVTDPLAVIPPLKCYRHWTHTPTCGKPKNVPAKRTRKRTSSHPLLLGGPGTCKFDFCLSIDAEGFYMVGGAGNPHHCNHPPTLEDEQQQQQTQPRKKKQVPLVNPHDGLNPVFEELARLLKGVKSNQEVFAVKEWMEAKVRALKAHRKAQQSAGDTTAKIQAKESCS